MVTNWEGEREGERLAEGEGVGDREGGWRRLVILFG